MFPSFVLRHCGLKQRRPRLDRCKKDHDPKNVGVLFVGSGDGTEWTRMDELESALALSAERNPRPRVRKGKKEKGRKK